MDLELESRSTSKPRTLYWRRTAHSVKAGSRPVTPSPISPLTATGTRSTGGAAGCPTSGTKVLAMHTRANPERTATEPVTSDGWGIERVSDSPRAKPHHGRRDGFCLSQFVERSTEASNVPLRVRDRQTLHAIVALMDPQYFRKPPTLDTTDRPSGQGRVSPGRGGWTIARAS